MIGGTGNSRSFGKTRLIIALVFIGFSLISYLGSKEYNPVTGEEQYISMTPRQEIALGLQAAPEMIQQYGGLYPDQKYQDMVDNIGLKLVRNTKAAETEYQFDFHLLNDRETINAFALPGGQIFITAALFGKLKTEAQLAGVLGHEIGHVVARHSAQQMAKSSLTQGILQGVLVASDPSGTSAQAAQYIGQLVNMKFGRDDELESDKIGVDFMSKSGYDPTALIGVMKILAEASGGRSHSEFFSTHPNPENRVEKIKLEIQKVYPNGVSTGLVK
ncbi:MAG: M48 family metalloprotease [Ignavibacteriales bacterium]|nr:M48 family metalloprotease [Ignavibacteriales bacterium]